MTRNTHVRGGVTPQGLEWALTSGDAANWFPITRLSHMLDSQLFGLRGGLQGRRDAGARVHGRAQRFHGRHERIHHRLVTGLGLAARVPDHGKLTPWRFILIPTRQRYRLAQAFALLPGISRSGITMVAGLVRGLDHEDSARFSFLLATPIILAAGFYKLPDLLGHNGDGVRPQILVGSLAAGIAAYLSVRFLARYFTARTLTPFAVYCLAIGLVCVVRFA